MTASIFLLTLSLPLATILIVFGMRYAAQVQQAKAKLGHQDAQQAIVDSLAEIKTRLAGIEKILKDVG